jgi:hypothetical protein
MSLVGNSFETPEEPRTPLVAREASHLE